MKNPDYLLQGERTTYVVLSNSEMGEELNKTSSSLRYQKISLPSKAQRIRPAIKM